LKSHEKAEDAQVQMNKKRRKAIITRIKLVLEALKKMDFTIYLPDQNSGGKRNPKSKSQKSVVASKSSDEERCD